MARVRCLPRADTRCVVDPKEILARHGGKDLDDPGLVAPVPVQSLRAFVVHQDPKFSIVPEFLSAAECAHLVTLGEGFWGQSEVGMAGSGALGRKPARTSSSCQLRYGQSPVLDRIERRVAGLARVDLDYLERAVLLRYEPGQQFVEHHDGKFRQVTVFLYLNDLPDDDPGGDTFFPHLGISVVPRAGCAAMWLNNLEDGSEDSRTVHAANPPRSGIKFGVNMFINKEPIRRVREPDVEFDHFSVVDVRSLLESDSIVKQTIRAFALTTEPVVTAIPNLLSAEEVAELLATVESEDKNSQNGFIAECGSSQILRLMKSAESPLVAQLEARFAAVSKFPPQNLGRLQVVKFSNTASRCNRCRGQKVIVVCLSARDKVLFPHLGVQLNLVCGDALLWPNLSAGSSSSVSSGAAAPGVVFEDMRTSRRHLGDGEPVVALSCSLFESAVRDAHAENMGRSFCG